MRLLSASPFCSAAVDPDSLTDTSASLADEIGCAFGAVFAFFAGDKLGRRNSIILGMIVLSIGAILQFMSYGLAQLIVGRIVTGLGNGLNVRVSLTPVSPGSTPLC